jgi:hypothetical protein
MCNFIYNGPESEMIALLNMKKTIFEWRWLKKLAAWIIDDKMIICETVGKADKLILMKSGLNLMFPESKTINKQIFRSKIMLKTKQNIFTFFKFCFALILAYRSGAVCLYRKISFIYV